MAVVLPCLFFLLFLYLSWDETLIVERVRLRILS